MFTEDISQFFNQDELADGITLDGVGVSANFNNGYALGGVGSVGMAGGQPFIELPTSLVPAAWDRKPVVADGVNYRVALHEPDGTGVSKLFLERTA